MCVKYPSHLVFNQNHRISFPYTTHFVFAIIDSSIELQELNHFIEEAILSLPERCRMVFVSSRFGNMSHKEIAKKMNISTKTVEAQITKALSVIRKYIAENS